MEQTFIFLNKKAHPYKDIKVPKEKLYMQYKSLIFFSFWRSVILLRRHWCLWLHDVAGSFASGSLTRLHTKCWQGLQTASSEGWAWEGSGYQLTHVVTEIFSSFKDVAWMASIPWWPPSLSSLSKGKFTRWQLSSWEQTREKRQRESLKKAEVIFFYNLITEVMFYHFCSILFLARNY